MWDIDTYTRHLLKSFILGPYAEHMKKYLYDIELSKMPETMPAVETYKKKFKRLAVQDKQVEIPFAYYNESIDACRRDDDEALRNIYTKYRLE